MKFKYWILISLSLCGCTALVTKECQCRKDNPCISFKSKKSNEKTRQMVSALIMGQGGLRESTMRKVLKKENPKLSGSKIHDIVRCYIEECHVEGINHDVAFAQMCLETDYLQYGGQVQAAQNNFAGLGATDDGARGAKFRTLRDGVRAHVQHLKAYASKETLKNSCIDPRFRFVKRGSARTIYDLAGKWASDQYYGKKIRDRMISFYKLQGI
jgi:hypothetical protein